jgi:hypothetical protein
MLLLASINAKLSISLPEEETMSYLHLIGITNSESYLAPDENKKVAKTSESNKFNADELLLNSK